MTTTDTAEQRLQEALGDLADFIIAPEDLPDWPSEQERARALRGSGMTYSAIAREMGIGLTTAWKHCRDDPQANAGCGRPKGERQWNSRLTARQVLAIREARRTGVPRRVLANRYDVTPSTIGKVASGRQWGWLTGDECLQGS